MKIIARVLNLIPANACIIISTLVYEKTVSGEVWDPK